MQVYVETAMAAEPIKISMSYNEALMVIHAISKFVPSEGGANPVTMSLLEGLKRLVEDPYFD